MSLTTMLSYNELVDENIDEKPRRLYDFCKNRIFEGDLKGVHFEFLDITKDPVSKVIKRKYSRNIFEDPNFQKVLQIGSLEKDDRSSKIKEMKKKERQKKIAQAKQEQLRRKENSKRLKIQENIIDDHLRLYKRKLENVEKQLKAGQPVIKAPCRQLNIQSIKEIEQLVKYGPSCPNPLYVKRIKPSLSSQLEMYPPDDPSEIIKSLDLFEERLMQEEHTNNKQSDP